MTAAIALLQRAWPYLVGALLIALLLFGTYRHGVQFERARLSAIHATELSARDQATANILAQQAEQSRANLEAAQAIARANMEGQQAIQGAFSNLTNQAVQHANNHTELRTCGLDVDGLRIWTDANRGGSTK